MKAFIAAEVVGNLPTPIELCDWTGVFSQSQFQLGELVYSPAYQYDYRVTAVTVTLRIDDQGQIGCSYHYTVINTVLGAEDEQDLMEEEMYRYLELERSVP